MSYLRYLGIVLGTLLLIPSFASAASAPKASCEITVRTYHGTFTFTDSSKENEVFIRDREPITVSWNSLNASGASLRSGSAIPLEGSETYTPVGATTYEYRFQGTKKTANCGFVARVTEGRIDAATLAATNAKPTISGTASGTDVIYLTLSKDAFSDAIYKTKAVRVKNGRWSTTVSKKLDDGAYDVNFYAGPPITITTYEGGGSSTIRPTLMYTNTLTVSAGKPPAITLARSAQPAAAAYGPGASSVPLLSFTIANNSSGIATIGGAWVKQKGTASNKALIGFGIRDNLGGSAGATGGTEGTVFPAKQSIYVPFNLTLGPNEARVMTVSGGLSKNLSGQNGKTFGLELVSLETQVPTTAKSSIAGPLHVIKAP